jgi:hypothetical protein
MRVFLCFLAINTTLLCQATGPSTLSAEIFPIGINAKGEIICKTRFTANPMGAQAPMPIEYGLLLVSADTIVEVFSETINPMEFDTYDAFDSKRQEYRNNLKKITEQDLKQLKNLNIDTKFKTNLNEYVVNASISEEDFVMVNFLSKSELKQQSLKGAVCTEFPELIEILYDFGEILFIKNESDFEGIQATCEFSYKNTIGTSAAGAMNVGYDYSNITGIIILNTSID